MGRGRSFGAPRAQPKLLRGKIGIYFCTIPKRAATLLRFLLGFGAPLVEVMGWAQERESLAGERAAQALKEAAQVEAQQYNVHCGPVSLQTGARVAVGYTDNVFYTEHNRQHD